MPRKKKPVSPTCFHIELSMLVFSDGLGSLTKEFIARHLQHVLFESLFLHDHEDLTITVKADTDADWDEI